MDDVEIIFSVNVVYLIYYIDYFFINVFLVVVSCIDVEMGMLLIYFFFVF